MPRKPKFKHPIRQVRETVSRALGHTISQAAFAKMVGTSEATIHSVEMGRLDVSQELASKVGAAFLIDTKTLRKKTGKPKTFAGRPFTEDCYRRASIPPTPAEAKMIILDMGLLAAKVIQAACSPEKNRQRSVAVSLTMSLVNIIEEYGLRKAFLKTWPGATTPDRPILETVSKALQRVTPAS